jgi:hypothetical protein
MKLFFSLVFLVMFIIPVVHAHCPLCTAAVGTGLVTARMYGIDDVIVGIWIGAFIISTALWGSILLKRRGIKIPFQDTILTLAAFLLTVVPFYFAGLFRGGHLFGVDKLLFGTVTGVLVSYAGFYLSGMVKRKKLLFPYQTIVLTLLLLVLSSLVLMGV